MGVGRRLRARRQPFSQANRAGTLRWLRNDAPSWAASRPTARSPGPGVSWPTSSEFREESLCIVASLLCPDGPAPACAGRLLDRADLGGGELGVDEELERVELLVLLHEAVQCSTAQPG